MKKLEITEKDKILILAPHPDDECIGAGGLLLRYASQCDVWLISDGRFGRREGISSSEIVRVRKNEFEAEMNDLGVNSYREFDLEDATLSMEPDLLKGENLFQYTKIFVPNKNDSHIDHRAVYQMLMNALDMEKCKEIRVYQYEITVPLDIVTDYLDVSAIMDHKKELIAMHKSQMQIIDYASMAKSLNRYRAISSGLDLSCIECFSQVRESELLSAYNFELSGSMQKIQCLNRIYEKWMFLDSDGNYIENLLLKNNVHNIAIYGYGKLGRLLLHKLLSGSVHVVGIIDKFYDGTVEGNIEILRPEELCDRAEMIIVTLVDGYRQVKQQLVSNGYSNEKIHSLEDLLDI